MVGVSNEGDNGGMDIRRVFMGLHWAALLIAVSLSFVPWSSFHAMREIGGRSILIGDLYVLDIDVYRFGYGVISFFSGLAAMVCAPPNKESYVMAVTTVLSFMLFCL